MIKTNLISTRTAKTNQAEKLFIPALIGILITQLIFLGLKYSDASQSKRLFNRAKERLETLQIEAGKYKETENLQDLAGKVAERNNWLLDKRNSPLNSLAKLQKDCPNNVRFLSFNADLTSGKIILTAPDLNSVSSWLNSHFSNRGNISVTGRENNLLMIQYIWSG